MGRLTRKKGFDLLLQALVQLECLRTAWILILAGEGEELTALKEQARQLGLERRVHFRGRASQEEIVRLLNGCLFLAIPSRVEPFGIVALEGLAAGKRILAMRVGGMAEFLDRESSLLRGYKPARPMAAIPESWPVNPTVEELVEGLRSQLSCPFPARGAAELSASVREMYSWRRVTQRDERILAG